MNLALILLFLLTVMVNAAHSQLPYNYYKQANPYGATPMPYPTNQYYGYPGYYQNPYGPIYPVSPGGQQSMLLPAPAPAAGGMFRINRGGLQMNLWRSSSGYYYPWCHQAYLYPSTNIIYMQEGSSAPAEPPLSTMFSDMKKYLQEAKEKGQVCDGDYNHLILRLCDLVKMERAARLSGDGALAPADESDIRGKVKELGLEISRAVKG